jgi:phage-related minor tail protein
MDSNSDNGSAVVTLKIAKELYDRVENRVKLSNEEFKSVEEYITFLITEVVKEDQDQLADSANAYTKEEEEEIKGRLKNLGYI